MWQQKIFNIEFYDIYYNFFIYSFFGWIWESSFVSCKKKKLINRGFLNGPIIPIYGAGATLVYIMFYNIGGQILELGDQPLELLTTFVLGMLLATILEYITSWVMELLFHMRWWDYSKCRFNINGRVCLKVSLFWGFLSILVTTAIQPFMNDTIIAIPQQVGEIAGCIIFFLFSGDLATTVVATVDLRKNIENMQKIRSELLEYMASTKIYETKTEIMSKLSEMSFVDLYSNFKDTVEERIDKVKERYTTKEAMSESRELKEEIEQRMREILTRYHNFLPKKGFIHIRLTNAFPNLKMKNREQALKDYRERSKIESLFHKKS